MGIMGREITPNPPLKEGEAKRFAELAKNPPPLKPAKILNGSEVDQILKGTGSKKEK